MRLLDDFNREGSQPRMAGFLVAPGMFITLLLARFEPRSGCEREWGRRRLFSVGKLRVVLVRFRHPTKCVLRGNELQSALPSLET